MDDLAVKVDKVSKDFLLPHERTSSIKSGVVNIFRKKNKRIERQHALKDISFEVKRGEFLGIVGRNGSGKSTLLKVLAEIYKPTKGSVEICGKLVPFIELGVGFNPELTGRENVYLNGALLGFSKRQINAIYDDIVAFAELERFMDQKLKNYSSGMQVRLAFSIATRAQADILLIDEVLAVGDADFQRKCFEYFQSLKKGNTTVVFVSHDMAAVREFCDRAILIDKSKLTFAGSPDEVADKYSQLFIDEDSETHVAPEDKRWGSGAARYKNMQVSVEGDSIIIDADIENVSSQAEKFLTGMHIASADGHEITATNNRLIRSPDLVGLEIGKTAHVRWKVLNIFTDGKYYVTLTVVDQTQAVLDWYNDAAAFRIKRPERSTTPVLPPMTVTYKVLK